MNPYQKAAAKAFSNGDHAHVEDMTQVDLVGDTLFLFIMRELEDVEDIDTARRRIDRAILDLVDVSSAVELMK
ncbi:MULTISPECIES: hypothetical protein [unclassified Mesorhizobium]|uniref:hypothetical protein n=1 Tax=unclassified Mesorhizobium TaxID=325217 RepID=UPI001128E45C|nr:MULTISPECIES: hypothetical protein [unclassified Mesorhizobium]TPL42567.1 hypothetical protein FJ961_07710 [Mesorhizobium sp. B2-4-5]TPL66567.1 hypothetical protein FJ949_09370 [Mesorhizobium sp. B2-4-1]